METTLAPFRILLVEDNPNDIEITRRALEKGQVKNELTIARDGQEALDILFGSRSKTSLPGLILLDLNLPRVDGREVLSRIKGDPELRRIPVIVLTTSADERDIQGCYRIGANSYIKKPVDMEGFLRAVQRLKDYWFEVVILPRLE